MGDTASSESFPNWIVGTVCCIAVLDVCTSRVTMPVLYTVPILLYALSHRRRWLWLLATLSVVFTFGGLAIKAHYFPPPGGHRMMWWRLLNRSLASAAVCLSAALLYYWVGFYDVIKQLATRAEDHQNPGDSTAFRQVLRSVTVILAAVVGTVLTGCILIADVFSPPPANLPILYAIPLILISLWLESRRAIWYLLPFMLIFVVIGELWGPPLTMTPLSLKSIVINRVFAAGR